MESALGHAVVKLVLVMEQRDGMGVAPSRLPEPVYAQPSSSGTMAKR